jgi:crossover junction endodeoxyribonuclease RuvC
LLKDPQAVRILGIDPGTATVGYGVLDTAGVSGKESLRYIASGIIQTCKDHSPGKRLHVIRCDVTSLIEEFRPDIMAIESLFFFKNAKTLVPVAQARGVILEAAEAMGIPAVGDTPMQVKLHLTGFGKADKEMVQLMVKNLLNLPTIIKPDDAADACAIAICHLRMTLTNCARAV